MAPGVRAHFEQRLAQLNEDVLQMGTLARRAVARGLQALVDSDQDLAREVIVEDVSLNRLRFELESQCYALLATEQPVASDMRVIVAALIIVNDLERVGDHGKMIARLFLRMLEDPTPIALGDIGRLGEMSLTMMDRALRALISKDVEEAQAICAADDEVDAFYKQTFNVVLSFMLENPRLIGAGTHLLQVAHELERVSDRATNVAERVIYTVTGELIDLNR
jgi:phosphate transport system protein